MQRPKKKQVQVRKNDHIKDSQEEKMYGRGEMKLQWNAASAHKAQRIHPNLIQEMLHKELIDAMEKLLSFVAL